MSAPHESAFFDPGGIPTFGEKKPNVAYIARPGAYAVIFDNDRRVAAMRGSSGYFLPGGGLEKGETLVAALHRELFEECVATVKILNRIGEARDFIYSKTENAYFEKLGTFYLAQFTTIPASPDLEWLDPRETKNLFRQKGHAWAVTRALNQPS
ncbi:MAG: NUDIX domain-containing protein [Chthoniobacteraceae bacterium]